MMRSGQSSKELDVLVRTMGKFGVSSAAAYESIAALGDTARKVGRGLAPELQRLESTFNDLHPLITKMAAESGADAAKDFWKFYWSTPADPDKRQTLLRAFHQDERIANITSEQWKKQNEEQQAFVNKNPDLSQKQREGLDQAFSKLSDSMDSLERSLDRATASWVAKGVKVLATDIDALASSVKGEPAPSFIPKGSIIDRLYFSHNLAPLAGAPGGSFKDRWSGLSDGGEKSLTEKFLKLLSHSGADLGGAGGSFQERWSGVSPDGEKSLTRGTKQGVLEALREYFAAEPAGGSGGAGGRRAGSVGQVGGRRSLSSRLGIDNPGTTVPDTTDPSAMGSDYLIKQRAGMAKELRDNPQLKKELAALTTLEGNPGNVTESLANRMASIHHSLRSGVSGAFYGPYAQVPAALAKLERDPKRMAAIMKSIDDVFDRGRNVLKGATDQGMVSDPNGRWQGGMVTGQDQVYNDWGGGLGHAGNARWRLDQQAHVNAEKRDLLTNEAKAGRTGTAQKIEGGADLRVAFDNAPSGMKAHLKNWGVFGDSGKVDWGHAMSPSDPGGR
jgi:hypothetical protein